MKQLFSLVLMMLLVSLHQTKAQNNTNAANETEKKSFQLTFVPPLSTNGSQAHKITNNVSVNLLGGVSNANEAFEFGGLFNVNKSYTKGFQFAGLTNITKAAEKSYQVAGITNIATEGNANFQLSGILNVAKNAKVQIGLINVADSISGTSIGLINIIKKNGKRQFEVGVSDALNTYASFKLGTNNFYTIFSAGVNYIDVKDDVQFAAGLGFGTEIGLKNNYATQIEVMGYALSEDKEFVEDLNMLTQLKFLLSKTTASRVTFFAGPTLNVTISKYKNEAGELTGTSLEPYSLFDNNSSDVKVNGWIGGTLGIRL